MGLIIGWCWGAVIAAGVYVLLTREAARRRATGDELDAIGVPDPGGAAALTLFIGLAAPYVLWRHRGARGLVEGLALLALAFVGTVVTSVALALVLHG